jgi:hypothetical protein
MDTIRGNRLVAERFWRGARPRARNVPPGRNAVPTLTGWPGRSRRCAPWSLAEIPDGAPPKLFPSPWGWLHPMPELRQGGLLLQCGGRPRGRDSRRDDHTRCPTVGKTKTQQARKQERLPPNSRALRAVRPRTGASPGAWFAWVARPPKFWSTAEVWRWSCISGAWGHGWGVPRMGEASRKHDARSPGRRGGARHLAAIPSVSGGKRHNTPQNRRGRRCIEGFHTGYFQYPF